MRPYGGRGYTPSQPPTARASNARPYVGASYILILIQRGGALVLVEFGLALAGHLQAQLVGLAQGDLFFDLLTVLLDGDGALFLLLGALGGKLGLILGLELLGL